MKLHPLLLRRRAVEVLNVFRDKGVDAPTIERALGLSPGYLSRIRSGERVPSLALVAELALLSDGDAVLNLREFVASWGGFPVQEHEEEQQQLFDFLVQNPDIVLEPDRNDRAGFIVDEPLIWVVVGTAVGYEQELAVHVAPHWDEGDHVELVVEVHAGRELIDADWPAALEEARKKANALKSLTNRENGLSS